MNRKSLVLAVIVCLAFVLRLYQFTTPLADWHSWRQADTASVAVEYKKHGLNLFQPKYLDLSSIPSGKENPEGYRMVEFPLIPGIVALISKLFPSAEVHLVFRFVNILISIGSLLFLYKIVQSFGNSRLALTSAFIFAVLPYNVFYSRTTLPEVALVFFSLGAIYFGLKPAYFLSASFAALALLIKPTAIFYLFVIWYVQFRHQPFKAFIRTSLLPLILSFIPLTMWRLWITQYPSGIPANLWLLNGNGIRFKGAWFRWLFADRLGRLILGYWGLIPLTLGYLSVTQKSKIQNLRFAFSQLVTRFSKPDSEPPHLNRFLYVWTLSLLLYLTIFATGNVQHDYYQYLLIPLISILVANGFEYLITLKNLSANFLASISLLFMLAFSWYEVRGFYSINNPAIVTAGRIVDQLVPSNALVIAPYQGDTAFLYQTNRRGWPIGGDIDQKIAAGATYYVSTTNDAETSSLIQKYTPLVITDSFTLIELK